jgi:hypothetical protein
MWLVLLGLRGFCGAGGLDRFLRRLFRWGGEGLGDGGFEDGEVVFDCRPDCLVVGAVVGVAQDIAHTAQASPVGAWASRFGIVPETVGCFAEDGELQLGRSFDHGIRLEGGEIQAINELLDQTNGPEDVLQVVFGASKRQRLPPGGRVRGCVA